jgi:membrane-associated phospholipid phosphatase
MARRSALAAFALAALAALVWAIAFRTGHGRQADIDVLQHLRTLDGTRAVSVFEFLAAFCNAAPYAVLALLVVLIALRTRGRVGAIVVLGVLLVPNVLTQILKTTTAEDRVGSADLPGVDAASWPSGHATAALALALCAVIAAPPARRLLVAVAGLAFAAAVGAAVIALGWHFPSDVAAGYLVAASAACLGVSLLETTAAPAARWQPARG